jgi:hypothetical protein
MSIRNAFRSVVLMVAVAEATGFYVLPNVEQVKRVIGKYTASFDGGTLFQFMEKSFVERATESEKQALNGVFAMYVANEEDVRSLAAQFCVTLNIR